MDNAKQGEAERLIAGLNEDSGRASELLISGFKAAKAVFRLAEAHGQMKMVMKAAFIDAVRGLSNTDEHMNATQTLALVILKAWFEGDQTPAGAIAYLDSEIERLS